MSQDAQRLADYLGHILEAIERIEGYTQGMDDAALQSNLMLQDAVIRNLEIIGEASHNIIKHHPDFAAANPDLPLNAAYQMRNAVAHGYFKVDLDIVWETVRHELPKLRAQVATLRATHFAPHQSLPGQVD